MRRNMEKIISETSIPDAYQLTFAECNKLMSKFMGGSAFEVISMAFTYGFELGKRCEKRRKTRTN